MDKITNIKPASSLGSSLLSPKVLGSNVGIIITAITEKVTVTQASTISTGGITNTVNHGIFIVSGTAIQLARGDRLAIRDGGDLTGLVGLSTTTIIKPLGKGHYAFVLGSAGRT